MTKGRPALPGAKLPATTICRTWPTASPSRKTEAAQTAAALKLRSRQKARQAVTPMARSAMPTSSWKGLTCQPMCAAETVGKKTWKKPAHRPVTPIGSSRSQARNRSGVERGRAVDRCQDERQHEEHGGEIADQEPNGLGGHACSPLQKGQAIKDPGAGITGRLPFEVVGGAHGSGHIC